MAGAVVVERSLAPWLDPATVSPLQLRIVKRALLDVGLCEQPPGSNRSGRIDEYNRSAGVPESLIESGRGYWCASAVRAWWAEAGAGVPPRAAASVDTWIAWAKRTGRWSSLPIPGAAVVYGRPGDGDHIGVVVRVAPLLLSVEGNTSLAVRSSAGYSRNGVAVDLKAVATDRVLGYVHPEPVEGQA